MQRPVINHDAARHRLVAPVGVLVFALFPISCSGTQQQVQPDGDVVLRSGPTALGWVGIVGGAGFVAVFLAFFAVICLAGLGAGLTDAVRSRQFLPAAGALLACLFATGFIALAGWAAASYTVLRYQTTVVAVSRSADDLSVTRSRLIGDDEVRRWHYDEIDGIEFEYIPGSGGDSNTPPQGVVSVHTSDGSETRIFEGSPCPGRDLAEGVTAATGIPIQVKRGPRDLSSWSALATQLRCGIEEPIDAKGWRDYPGEVSRVLDVPSLLRWPWLLPFLAAQLALIAALWIVDKRWLEPSAPTALRAAVWVVVVLTAVALHFLAAKDYGSWPAALAVFALVSARVAASRLGLTFFAMLRRWGTST